METLTKTIQDECQRLIVRHETYAHRLSDESRRRRQRSTKSVARLIVRRPWYWAADRRFDPYIVRARATTYSHAISDALRNARYEPAPPALYTVPKPGGGTRNVAVFQIPDNAVSRRVYRSLLAKNRAKMSARSYAYRADLTAHDALQYVQAELFRHKRIFIAEYDFSEFFDSIRHEHIWQTLESERYLLTPTEHRVIQTFLTAPEPRRSGYGSPGPPARAVGVPLGTSISLFLANVAAGPLDKALERLDVGFVRYADDTLIWATTYEAICRAVDEVTEAAARIGSRINLAKSEGIRLLVEPGWKSEIKKTETVEFLGYELSLDRLSIKRATIDRVKEHLGKLIYYNLICEPSQATQDLRRLTNVDRDYAMFIWQARRYLYGDLSEADVRRYQMGGIPLRRFKGLMSYYPLVDDDKTLAELDGWLATQAWLAMRRRGSLLRRVRNGALPPPHGLPLDKLIGFRTHSPRTGQIVDLQLPSFRRIAQVLRTAALVHGPNQIGRRAVPYEYM